MIEMFLLFALVCSSVAVVAVAGGLVCLCVYNCKSSKQTKHQPEYRHLSHNIFNH